MTIKQYTDEQMRELARRREEAIIAERLALSYAEKKGFEKGFAESFEKGRAEGFAESFEKGRAEGFAESFEKGRTEGINALLEAMRAAGLDTSRVEALNIH